MTSLDQRVPVSLGSGEGEAIWYMGGLSTVKADAAATAGACDIIEALVPPGMSPPWHVHRREDESFFVLDGCVTFYVGGQTIRAERGAFVLLPRGIPHTFRVEGTEPACLWQVITPAGLWGFFQEMGEPARERTLAPTRDVDLAKLRRVAARYEIEILAPPPA